MGLAIVRRMAALLDHPLHLNSASGEGSTFAIDVPIATGMTTPASTPASTANRRPVPPTETILLVDDDPTVLASLRMLLEAMEYHVRAAESATSARSLVGGKDDLPDLIITDYRLPETAVSAVYPQNRHLSPKIRVFVDFLAGRFGPEPYWDREAGIRAA